MKLDDRIKEELGVDEFWKDGTLQTLRRAIAVLKKHGFDEGEALDFVSMVYGACAHERGD